MQSILLYKTQLFPSLLCGLVSPHLVNMAQNLMSTGSQSADVTKNGAGTEVLSGQGTGQLQRLLVGQRSGLVPKPDSSDLVSRLRQFLPEIARANEALPEAGQVGSAVEILIPTDDESDDEDIDSEDEDDSDVGNDEDEEIIQPNKASVEMNISLFPIDDDEEEDDDNELAAESVQIIEGVDDRSKRKRVEEVEEEDDEDDVE